MEKKASKIGIIFNIIAIIVTIAVSVATVLAYFATSINPNSVWWIAFLGLGGQLLILANFVVMAYWIAQFKWIAILPAIVMMCGGGFWGDFYQFQFSKHYEHQGENDVITIATYNVKAFGAKPDSFEQIAKIVSESKADIVCFQEFGHLYNSQDSARIEKYYSQFEHKTIGSDMAVFAKYPLHATKIIRFPETANNAMRVDVVVHENTVALYNLHLQTTEFNQVSGGGVQAIVDHENSAELAKVAGSAMKRNYVERVAQADSINLLASDEKSAVIILGDFNDTPMSYTYATIKGGNFDDAFRIAGNGYGYSYRGLMKLFRIDYVMAHNEFFEVVGYDSPDVDYSDHNPVVVKLKFKQK